MLRLARRDRKLGGGVADQLGCPTSENDIAAAIVDVARRLVSDDSRDLRGVLNLTGAGEAS